MHIIKETMVTAENQCLKKLLRSHLKVRKIWLSTEDSLERLNNKNWKKNEKNDPEGDTRSIASDNKMQLDNCGLCHNSGCSLQYHYCRINHTKNEKAGVGNHQ